MLLFGHLGVTLGIFFGLSIFVPRLRTIIDPRYLAIGALLPDLIDKPVGEIILASTFSSGRIFGHTLIFSLLLLLISLYLYDRRKDIKGLSLASGSFLHLFEDMIPADPEIFFWPLLGWTFPRDSRDYVGLEHLINMLVRSFHIEFLLNHTAEIMATITGIIIGALLFLYWSKKRLEKKSSSEIAGKK
ncbi:metal-dependent hydrolase [Methanosarcina hadiensis]|uniref:metal-dependent hydrolase n=1 Tax=Methanosarcina hadiensis TaxID=3078083 RepID=UPI0039776EFE